MTVRTYQNRSYSCSCLCRYDVKLLVRLDSWTGIFLIDGERIMFKMARMIGVPDVGQTGVIYSYPLDLGQTHIFEKYDSQCWRRQPAHDTFLEWAWISLETAEISWHLPGDLPDDIWGELPAHPLLWI